MGLIDIIVKLGGSSGGPRYDEAQPGNPKQPKPEDDKPKSERT